MRILSSYRIFCRQAIIPGSFAGLFSDGRDKGIRPILQKFSYKNNSEDENSVLRNLVWTKSPLLYSISFDVAARGSAGSIEVPVLPSPFTLSLGLAGIISESTTCDVSPNRLGVVIPSHTS